MQKEVINKNKLIADCDKKCRNRITCLLIIVTIFGLIFSWMNVLKCDKSISVAFVGTVFMLVVMSFFCFMLMLEGNQLIKCIQGNDKIHG